MSVSPLVVAAIEINYLSSAQPGFPLVNGFMDLKYGMEFKKDKLSISCKLQ